MLYFIMFGMSGAGHFVIAFILSFSLVSLFRLMALSFELHFGRWGRVFRSCLDALGFEGGVGEGVGEVLYIVGVFHE